mgnify:FL=1
MVYIMDAGESRNGGSRKMELQKGRLCEEISFRDFSLWQARKDKSTLKRTKNSPNAGRRTDEEDAGSMALSEEAR